MQASTAQGSASTTDYFAASNAGISQLYSYDLLDQFTQIQYRQTTSSTSNASAGNLIDQIDYTYDKDLLEQQDSHPQFQVMLD